MVEEEVEAWRNGLARRLRGLVRCIPPPGPALLLAPRRQALLPHTAALPPPPPHKCVTSSGRVLMVPQRLKGVQNLHTARCKLQLSFTLFSSAGEHLCDGEALPPPPAQGPDDPELHYNLEELDWSTTPFRADPLVRKYAKRSSLAPILSV